MEKFRFNTMLAKLMTLVNTHVRGRAQSVSDAAWDEAIRALLLMLAPSAPHLTEELWTSALGQPYSIHRQSWPTWDPALAAEDELKVGVSVNGKPRGELLVSAALQGRRGADHRRWRWRCRASSRWSRGKTVRRVIYVPGKMLNLVVS